MFLEFGVVYQDEQGVFNSSYTTWLGDGEVFFETSVQGFYF